MCVVRLRKARETQKWSGGGTGSQEFWDLPGRATCTTHSRAVMHGNARACARPAAARLCPGTVTYVVSVAAAPSHPGGTTTESATEP